MKASVGAFPSLLTHYGRLLDFLGVPLKLTGVQGER